jgi:hypothetical protein
MITWSNNPYDLRSHDVKITKYLIIILITYNKVSTCHMQHNVILLYDHIVILYNMNNMIKYMNYLYHMTNN